MVEYSVPLDGTNIDFILDALPFECWVMAERWQLRYRRRQQQCCTLREAKIISRTLSFFSSTTFLRSPFYQLFPFHSELTATQPVPPPINAFFRSMWFSSSLWLYVKRLTGAFVRARARQSWIKVPHPHPPRNDTHQCTDAIMTHTSMHNDGEQSHLLF